MGLFVTFALLALALEVLLKPMWRRRRGDRYFRDSWHVFSFLVTTTIIGGIGFSEVAAEFATVILVVRLLRLLQEMTTVKAMHQILTTMLRANPDMAHILILLCIVIYLYALYGHGFFKDHDPEHWGSLGESVLSLFQVVTLVGWSEIMQAALAAVDVR